MDVLGLLSGDQDDLCLFLSEINRLPSSPVCYVHHGIDEGDCNAIVSWVAKKC